MVLSRLLKYALYGCICGLIGLLIGCAQTPDGTKIDSRSQSSVITNRIGAVSMDTFVHQAIETDAYPDGFKPDDTYTETIETFQKTMIGLLQKLVMTQMFGDVVTKDSDEQKRRDAQMKEFIETHLDVRSIKQRPLVIYPENAEKVIQDVCPESDFNVIVLGKNVYLSMQMLAVDTYPHVNRMYLDMVDIRHGQVDYEISQISMLLFNRLKPLLSSVEGS
jgi:hypothetical protein